MSDSEPINDFPMSYRALIACKPLGSKDLMERDIWWWRNLDAEMNTKKYYWLNSHFGTIWEKSAIIYELAARIEGEYEHNAPWASLKLRQHSLIHARWDRAPIGKAFESWKREWVEIPIRRVEESRELYQPQPGWTLPLSFNLSCPTEDLVKAFRNRVETIKSRIPNDKPENTENKLWRIVELFDKKNLGNQDLQEGELSIIEKVVKTYETTQAEALR